MKSTHDTTGMKILALDLGKNSSVFCVYLAGSGVRAYGTVSTSRQAMQELLIKQQPERLVIEIGPAAGWVHDLAGELGIPIQVANTNHEAWRWKHVKRKTDRRDARRLAELSVMNQLPTVYMPSRQVRQWRSLISYRRSLVKRRTQIKNNIRAILDREGLSMPTGKSGWTQKSVARLRAMAEVEEQSIWRFELGTELNLLESLEGQIAEVQKKLAAIANRDERVALLKTAPAVGDRLAEAIVAVVDDPHRFSRGRDVGCYVGMTPRQYQSGQMDRQGRISGEGNAMLRSLLVECAWLGVSRLRVQWMVDVYEQVCQGSPNRKKIAIVAVARRLLIRCWAMLRDDSPWRDRPEQQQTVEETPPLQLAA